MELPKRCLPILVPMPVHACCFLVPAGMEFLFAPSSPSQDVGGSPWVRDPTCNGTGGRGLKSSSSSGEIVLEWSLTSSPPANMRGFAQLLGLFALAAASEQRGPLDAISKFRSRVVLSRFMLLWASEGWVGFDRGWLELGG